MNNKLIITAISIILLLVIRFIFCYRIIPFPNSGNLKYKESEVVYFPHFAFINPFKRQEILTKITDYFKSDNFLKENESNELKYFREKSLTNELEILSMKTENNNYLILVSSKDNSEAEFVFVLDQGSDLITGHK